MSNLYLTQDVIGTPTGGGQVTYNECMALSSLGVTHPIDGRRIPPGGVFETDRRFMEAIQPEAELMGGIAHIYSGCFSNTVARLKEFGMRVSYTAAAHSVKLSEEEHVGLGIPFNYEHLTNRNLWEQYVAGYKLADLVICPSNLSAELMRSYGCTNVIVIPHGVDCPVHPPPLPKKFAVGYFGAVGPDKGLRYLLEAWKKLAYRDATLILGGRASVHAGPLLTEFGGGNIEVMGGVDDLGDFYKRVTVYVQPSVSEGFGIEVLEAAAYRRMLVVSKGAGAHETVHPSVLVDIRNPDQIAAHIEEFRTMPADEMQILGSIHQIRAWEFKWPLIREQYVRAWAGWAHE